MDGNIFNSRSIHVAIVRGPAHGIVPDAANPVFISVSFRRCDPKGLC
jgi:hypothetical protein